MSEPREFWIDEVKCFERGFFIADVGYDKPCGIVEGQKIVQLIEKSAYTKLQAALDVSINTLRKIKLNKTDDGEIYTMGCDCDMECKEALIKIEELLK